MHFLWNVQEQFDINDRKSFIAINIGPLLDSFHWSWCKGLDSNLHKCCTLHLSISLSVFIVVGNYINWQMYYSTLWTYLSGMCRLMTIFSPRVLGIVPMVSRSYSRHSHYHSFSSPLRILQVGVTQKKVYWGNQSWKVSALNNESTAGKFSKSGILKLQMAQEFQACRIIFLISVQPRISNTTNLSLLSSHIHLKT